MDDDRLRAGDVVVDVDVHPEDRSEAVVVNCPPKRIDEWDVDGRGTVAEDNPTYPESDRVVIVVYRRTLEYAFPYYSGVRPIPLRQLLEDDVSFYAFPEGRLEAVDAVGSHEVALDRIEPAPWHARNFNADENRQYIESIRERGHPRPYPLVRVQEDAGGRESFQLVNGHKRVWASHVVGLEEIPVVCLYQPVGEYVRAWANRHLDSYSPAERSVAMKRLRADDRVDATALAPAATDGGGDGAA